MKLAVYGRFFLTCIIPHADDCHSLAWFYNLFLYWLLKMNYMNSASKILLTIGASVAAGAILGMLYAPDEGIETRKKIMKRSKKLAGMVGDSIDDGKESLEEIRTVLQKQLNKVNENISRYKSLVRIPLL